MTLGDKTYVPLYYDTLFVNNSIMRKIYILLLFLPERYYPTFFSGSSLICEIWYELP